MHKFNPKIHDRNKKLIWSAVVILIILGFVTLPRGWISIGVAGLAIILILIHKFTIGKKGFKH